jgi:hypothetical protein
VQDPDYWMAYATVYNHGVRHPAHVAGCSLCWNMARAEQIVGELIDCPSPPTCRIDHDHILGLPRPEVIPELLEILEEEG